MRRLFQQLDGLVAYKSLVGHDITVGKRLSKL